MTAEKKTTAKKSTKSAKKPVTQADLAQKAMKLKEEAAGNNPMQEDGGPLAPNDPEASPGKAALEDTARRAPPSGALDHGGAGVAQRRAGERGPRSGQSD